MKTLSRNKRKFYYRQFVSNTAEVDTNGNETGCVTSTYGDWTEIQANYSAGSNTFGIREFGFMSDSDRKILFAKGDCPLLETSQIYIGSTAPTSSTAPNYYVTGISDSLNSTIVNIKEVDVG